MIFIESLLLDFFKYQVKSLLMYGIAHQYFKFQQQILLFLLVYRVSKQLRLQKFRRVDLIFPQLNFIPQVKTLLAFLISLHLLLLSQLNSLHMVLNRYLQPIFRVDAEIHKIRLSLDLISFQNSLNTDSFRVSEYFHVCFRVGLFPSSMHVHK